VLPAFIGCAEPDFPSLTSFSQPANFLRTLFDTTARCSCFSPPPPGPARFLYLFFLDSREDPFFPFFWTFVTPLRTTVRSTCNFFPATSHPLGRWDAPFTIFFFFFFPFYQWSSLVVLGALSRELFRSTRFPLPLPQRPFCNVSLSASGSGCTVSFSAGEYPPLSSFFFLRVGDATGHSLPPGFSRTLFCTFADAVCLSLWAFFLAD